MKGNFGWLAVGRNGMSGSNATSGAAYLFELVSGTWMARATLRSDQPRPYNTFGASIALEGDVLVVGDPDDPTQADTAGSIYLFEQSGGSWSQGTKDLREQCSRVRPFRRQHGA